MSKSLLAILLITASAGAAHANGTMQARYPGTLCQVPSGNTDGTYSELFGVFNQGNNPVTVQCPVPFDYAFVNLQVLVSVTAYDRNTTTDVNCRFINTNPDGQNAHFTGFGHTTSSGNASQTFSLGAVNITADQALTIECTIPPQQAGSFSHVVSYGVMQSP